MKNDIWMPLYVADLLADTLHLSAAEFGAYVLLICAYWRRRGPLPNDAGVLAQIARCTETEWQRNLNGKLTPLFQVNTTEWSHKRIDAELLASAARRKAGSKAGKVSAEAKRQRKLNDTPTNPQQNVNESSSNHNHKNNSIIESTTLAEIPSVKEVAEFGTMRGVPKDFCEHYHAVCTEKHRWLVKGPAGEKLIVWQSELVRWWTRDRHNWKPSAKADMTPEEMLRAAL